MFLANKEFPAPWAYHAKYALILPLERVLAHCKWLSIPEEGIYLIDAENLDSFTEEFRDIKIKLSTFIMMCANTNRQIIRYLRKDMVPPIVAPSERSLADDALREIAMPLHNQQAVCNTKDTPEKTESIILLRVDLSHGGNRGNYHWITRVGAKYGEWNFKTCESIFDARPFDTIKEVDNYLGALPLDKYNIFVSEHNRQTRVMIGTGYVKTTQRAKNDAQQNKGVISGLQQPTETIADDSKVVTLPKEEQPEAKKRTAYALCDYIDGEPSYFCAEYAELYIKRGKENVQVFPTKQDAEFYNAIFMARYPNQAEMYVVEIEY